MPIGCGWDLLGAGKNLDGSGGEVATVLAAGDSIFSADGAAGVGTKIEPREAGQLTGHFGISEDGALVEYWIKNLNNLSRQIRTHVYQTGQAEGRPLDALLGRCNLPLTLDDRIQVALTNAAAKMDAVFMLMGKGGTMPDLLPVPGKLPKGAMNASITTGHTSTADAWTAGDVTFEDYELNQNAWYEILQSVQYGATLMAYRLVAKSGVDVGNRPGGPGGDTDQINAPHAFTPPYPRFHGKNGLQMETMCHAGDTATLGNLVIRKVA